MTMVSFRLDPEQAGRAGEWARRLGVDRSELLRDALRLHLDRLASEREADTWVDDDESVQPLAAAADWGPAEDWTEWRDASG